MKREEGGHFCGNIEAGEASAYRSATCDVNISSLPIKTIRITVHVFQKDDGSENIPNNSSGINYINSVISDANSKLGSMVAMNLSSPSPLITDTKVRYALKNIYFWQNTTMWSKGNNTSTNGNALYSFVQGQSISYKSNSIHIFIPGNYGSDGSGSQGIASGIGHKDWTHLEDVYSYYSASNHWDIANTLRHEIGHNLSLRHSFPSSPSDFCDDTPPNANCWNGSGCSNNIMDYNASKRAITLDQVSRIHTWLHNSGSTLVQSGAFNSTITGTISTGGGYNGTMYYSNNLGVPDATVTGITATGGVSSFTWTKTGGTGSFTSYYDGTQLNLTGVTTLYMKATWEANCEDFSANITFYDPGAFFVMGPNPTGDELNVSVKDIEGLKALSSELSNRQIDTGLEQLILRDKGGHIVVSMEGGYAEQATLDLQALKSDTYFLEIKNGELSVTEKILKL